MELLQNIRCVKLDFIPLHELSENERIIKTCAEYNDRMIINKYFNNLIYLRLHSIYDSLNRYFMLNKLCLLYLRTISNEKIEDFKNLLYVSSMRFDKIPKYCIYLYCDIVDYTHLKYVVYFSSILSSIVDAVNCYNLMFVNLIGLHQEPLNLSISNRYIQQLIVKSHNRSSISLSTLYLTFISNNEIVNNDFDKTTGNLRILLDKY